MESASYCGFNTERRTVLRWRVVISLARYRLLVSRSVLHTSEIALPARGNRYDLAEVDVVETDPELRTEFVLRSLVESIDRQCLSA